MKQVLCLLAVLMMVFVSVSISSCKDDDDKDNEESLIVGTWVVSDDEGGYTFNSDGTGRGFEFHSGNKDFGISDQWDITYSYNSNEKQLIIIEGVKNPHTFVYNVISLSSTTLVLRLEGKERIKTWIKM